MVVKHLIISIDGLKAFDDLEALDIFNLNPDPSTSTHNMAEIQGMQNQIEKSKLALVVWGSGRWVSLMKL